MADAPAPQISWKAKVAVFVVLVTLMGVATELFARQLMIRRFGPWIVEGPDDPEPPDPLLGWSADANTQNTDKYGPGRHVTFNARAMRDTEDYSVEVPEGRYRVVCVGDSFTFGAGLADEETYPEQLERFVPSLQAVNLGMGGYGVDQAVLWYERDAVALEHDLVLLAFIADDYRRMTLAAFQLRSTKPRFVLDEAGELELTNVPVPSWGQRGYWRDFPWSTATHKILFDAIDARTVRASYDRVAVAERLFARVKASADAAGRQAALVYLPTTGELEQRCPDGESWCKKPGRDELLVAVEAAAARVGMTFVDATPPFRRVQDAEALKPYFQDDGHYTAKGATLLAEYLAGALAAKVDGFPAVATASTATAARSAGD